MTGLELLGVAIMCAAVGMIAYGLGDCEGASRSKRQLADIRERARNMSHGMAATAARYLNEPTIQKQAVAEDLNRCAHAVGELADVAEASK